MSCTVVSLPFALAYVIAKVAVSSISAFNEIDYFIDNTEISNTTNTIDNLPNIAKCDDIDIISTKHFIEKDLETVFMDKELLIKTLEEHGLILSVDEDEIIRGKIDSYVLTFTKPAEDKPYNLNITCSEGCSPEEKLNDLSGEYALNVQEDAYLSIVNNLKANNMQIEEEVVEDDNTIVLTINIGE